MGIEDAKKWNEDRTAYTTFCTRVNVEDVRLVGTDTRDTLGINVTSAHICGVCLVSSPLGNLVCCAALNDHGCLELMEPFDSDLAQAKGEK